MADNDPHATGYGPKPNAPDSGATRYGAAPPDPDATFPQAPKPPADEYATRYGAVPPPDPHATNYTPTPPAPPQQRDRRVLPCRFGDYELLEEIARGGMGVVYKARQRVGDRERLVALKLIRSGRVASGGAVERFLREAHAAAALDHPGIVPIYDIGEHDGEYYFTMQLLPGGSLADLVRERPLPPNVAAQLVRQVAEAVQHAHDKGILHRDLKPANILLQEEGTTKHTNTTKEEPPHEVRNEATPASDSFRDVRVFRGSAPKITDFGLARTQESGLSLTGEVMGTPGYMPPEQARGDVRVMGPAVDVYGLGAVLYCLLTGRPPFQAADVPETLRQVCEAEPVPPRQLNPAVPRDLETICLKCLAKEPQRRYATAAELADDLGQFQAGEPIRARPVGVAERAVKWVQRRPMVAALGALIVMVTLGALVGISWAYGRALHAEGQARSQQGIAEQARDLALQAKTRAEAAEAEEKRQRDSAVQEKTRADERAEESRGQLANSKVVLADAAWREGQPRLAWQHLEAVPVDLRLWEWRYLKRASEGGSFTLRGHTGRVESVAFSLDGQRLATGSWDRTAKVWDARTGELLLDIKGHTLPVTSVAFSPDGLRIATGGGTIRRPGEAKVWDARTGEQLLDLKGHTSWVYSVAFSPDGRQLATGSGTAKVWDAGTGQQLLELKGHTQAVTSVAFSADSQRLATGSFDNSVKVWVVRTGQQQIEVRGHTGSILSVAFSPDGQRLATGSRDKTVRVWDVRTGQQLIETKTHTSSVYSVAFSPDGQRLASTSGDLVRAGEARVWDVRTGQLLLAYNLHTTLIGSVAFSPDGQRLATGSWDATAKIWDARTAQQPLAFRGHTSAVTSVAFGPDGQRLATGSWDKTAKVWDACSGQLLLELKGHTGGVSSVAFSPDGQRLASACGGFRRTVRGEAKVWDTGTGQLLLELKGHTGPVNSVAFTPDGQRIATGGETAKIWNALTGQLLLELKGHTSWIWSVAFSPDGQRLASASEGPFRSGGFGTGPKPGEAKVWDARTGKQLLELMGHTDSVTSVAFSPDGQHLATGSLDGTAKVWGARTGQLLLELKGHTGGLASVAFSPDGRRLASGSGVPSAAGEAKVWDTRTGQQLLDLQGYTGGIVGSVAFSPHGQRLATTSVDGAKVWDARPVQVPPDAEELLIRRHRTTFDAAWHQTEAARHEQAGQWFAVAYHLAQLQQHGSADAALADRLARAQARWREQAARPLGPPPMARVE